MRLPLPPNFDLPWTLGILAARTVPSMEAVAEGKEYRRSLRTGGRMVTLALRRRSTALEVRTAPALPRDEVRRLVARMFDLDSRRAYLGRLAAGVGRVPGVTLGAGAGESHQRRR